jgi:hypothetical protein
MRALVGLSRYGLDQVVGRVELVASWIKPITVMNNQSAGRLAACAATRLII